MSCWVIIPAAGMGKRMASKHPKQYLPLCGQTVIEHSIHCFLDMDVIQQVVVAVHPDDEFWPKIAQKYPKISTVIGGAERCQSVFNALDFIRVCADEHDWVLTHDAARPCVQRQTIERLMNDLKNHPVGGLLAQPVRDTMKLGDAQGVIQRTVARDNLWHAQTPQMFRVGLLHHALEQALANNLTVTDEAQAMELQGHYGQLVVGEVSNLKITHPADWVLAEFYLKNQACYPV